MNPLTERYRMRRAGTVWLCGAVLLVVSSLGCGTPEQEKAPLVSVQVTPVRKASIEETISAEAVVFPVQQAVITPKITSTIKEFLVQRGSRVRKGQLLAVLENSDLSAAAEQNKGEFEQAEAGYANTAGASIPQAIQKAELDAAAAKVAFDAQQKAYNSRKELFQQGALPRRDLDSAEVALAQARSQSEVAQKQLEDLKRIGEREALKSASGQLAAARGKYRGATAQLSYSEIRSPMDGVVTDRPQYAGELATANQPLLTVMDTSKLIAKAHVAQSEAAYLKVGNKAQLHLKGLDDPLEGAVTLVSPALDSGSTTIEVWVQAKKPNPALRPGMTVQLSITGRSAKDALLVPVSAVFKNEEGADYVAVAGTDNHAQLKTLQTGIRNTDSVQVTSGLKEGEPVITSGGYALPDKTPIKIEAPTEKGSTNNRSEGSEKGKE